MEGKTARTMQRKNESEAKEGGGAGEEEDWERAADISARAITEARDEEDVA